MKVAGFSKEINGLRAVAVLAVLLFHFKVPGFEGGFVGVDVFFVISGFLMTKIIFRQLENNGFSVARFYFGRARRIIPALAVLCAFLVVAGWFSISPSDYERLGKHVLASLLFVSNIIYWKESGYFDLASHEKFLLHSWSLSVEWQFYIVYPLVVLAIFRLTDLRRTGKGLVLLAALSLILSICCSSLFPQSSFFLLHTRAWEMLVGGLLYLYPPKIPQRICGYFQPVGLALIFVSILCFSGEDAWPGWLAMVPVSGAVLVMAASAGQSYILTNRLCQWGGRISYSVYLWHWPLVVLGAFQDKTGQLSWICTALVLSFLLGELSWRFVETPMRKMEFGRHWGGFALSATALSILCLLFGGVYVYSNAGIPERFPILQMTQKELTAEWDKYAKDFTARHGHTKKKVEERIGTTLVVGSSHARDLAKSLMEAGYGEKITSFRTAICGNFSNSPNLTPWKVCEKLNKALLMEIETVAYSRIFLHDHWPDFEPRKLSDILVKIRQRTDVPIYVFGPKMTYSQTVLRIIHNGISSGLSTPHQINLFARQYQGKSIQFHIRNSREKINSGLVSFFQENSWEKDNIYFIDVMRVQCGEKMECEVISHQDYKPLYFDTDHWTLQGAREFGKKLRDSHPELFVL